MQCRKYICILYIESASLTDRHLDFQRTWKKRFHGSWIARLENSLGIVNAGLSIIRVVLMTTSVFSLFSDSPRKRLSSRWTDLRFCHVNSRTVKLTDYDAGGWARLDDVMRYWWPFRTVRITHVAWQAMLLDLLSLIHSFMRTYRSDLWTETGWRTELQILVSVIEIDAKCPMRMYKWDRWKEASRHSFCSQLRVCEHS